MSCFAASRTRFHQAQRNRDASPRGIDAKPLITHRFKLDEILQAYETFGKAADTKALKVIIEA